MTGRVQLNARVGLCRVVSWLTHHLPLVKDNRLEGFGPAALQVLVKPFLYRDSPG